jgi:TfoX/Sxy family transcriptional regulator of competence genes
VAYDEALASRIREILDEEGGASERKMFGGIAYMHRDHMFIGIIKNELMVRVGAEAQEKVLKKKGVRPMDFTGRPLKGYVYVEPVAFKTKASLRKWIHAGHDFVETLPPKKKKKAKPRVKKASSRNKPVAKKKSARTQN